MEECIPCLLSLESNGIEAFRIFFSIVWQVPVVTISSVDALLIDILQKLVWMNMVVIPVMLGEAV